MIEFIYKNWFFHNVVAHPLMYFTAFYDVKLSKRIHDSTLPANDFNEGGKFPISMGLILVYGIFHFTVDLYGFLLILLNLN